MSDVEIKNKLVIDTKDLAKLLGVSTRHIANMRDQQLLPNVVRLGTSVRFVLEEIEAWLRGGCPNLEDWENMKEFNIHISRPLYHPNSYVK